VEQKKCSIEIDQIVLTN